MQVNCRFSLNIWQDVKISSKIFKAANAFIFVIVDLDLRSNRADLQWWFIHLILGGILPPSYAGNVSLGSPWVVVTFGSTVTNTSAR